MPVLTDWPELVDADRLSQWTERRCSSMGEERFAEAMRAMLEVARADGLIQPRAAYQSFDVDECGEDWVRLRNGHVIEQAPVLAEVMDLARSLVAAVTTIGDRLEAEVSSLFKRKQALKALALEEIGVAAQFELSTALGAVIAGDAQSLDLEASGPLFPGNEGFDLGQQKTVFELAGGGGIGMRLSAGAMLHPVKSGSLIFALGKNMPRWDQTRDCAACKAREKCRYRRHDLEAAA